MRRFLQYNKSLILIKIMKNKIRIMRERERNYRFSNLKYFFIKIIIIIISKILNKPRSETKTGWGYTSPSLSKTPFKISNLTHTQSNWRFSNLIGQVRRDREKRKTRNRQIIKCFINQKQEIQSSSNSNLIEI